MRGTRLIYGFVRAVGFIVLPFSLCIMLIFVALL
jgi:hypothetical protein